MVENMKRFLVDDGGQDLIEYALLAGLISLMAVTAILNVGTKETLSGLDLKGTSASGAQMTLGTDALFKGSLTAAGMIANDAMTGPAGLGRTLTATQFFPVTAP